MVFGAREDQLEIGLGGYRFWQCLPEAGPAGATVVLHLAVEQGLRAGGADERSVALFAVERASPGRLGVFFEHDAIGGRCVRSALERPRCAVQRAAECGEITGREPKR